MDIKQVVKDLGTAVEELKKTTQTELAEIKQKGAADPVTTEKLDKLNNAVSDLQGMKTKFEALPEQLKQLERQINHAGRGGDGVPSIEAKERSDAMRDYLMKGDVVKAQTKAMTVGSDANGGVTVHSEMSDTITKRLYDLSPIRQVANIITISSDALEILEDSGDITGGWESETSTTADTATPTMSKKRISAHVLAARPKVSGNLLEDSAVDIEAYLSEKLADRFARLEAAAFVAGDGVARPRGFTTLTTDTAADGTRAWGSLQVFGTGNSGDFASSASADVLMDITTGLKQAYRQGAVWVAPRAVIAKIRKFKGATNGDYLWRPGLDAGQPETVLGYQVVEAEDMPALGANSLSMAFGNFKQGYTIVDRLGLVIVRDPYSAKPYIEFYTRKRVGGDVTNSDAIKLVKFG